MLNIRYLWYSLMLELFEKNEKKIKLRVPFLNYTLVARLKNGENFHRLLHCQPRQGRQVRQRGQSVHRRRTGAMSRMQI